MSDELLPCLNEYLQKEALLRWGGYPGDHAAFHQVGDEVYTYETITIGGIKAEGRAMPSRSTALLAADALFQQLDAYLGHYPPIWRETPIVRREGKQFYATARVAKEEMR